MERGGAYDSMESWLEREMKQIAREQMQSASEFLGEMSARGAQHVLRQVDRDHMSSGQCLEQFGGEESGSATGV
jgi:hypothetical protein